MEKCHRSSSGRTPTPASLVATVPVARHTAERSGVEGDDRVKPKYLVSWHQPLNGVDSYGVKDRNLMHRLSQGLDLPIRYLDCHGSCHGTMTGWYNARHPARRSRWSTAPAPGHCGR